MTLARALWIAEHNASRAAQPNVTRRSLIADDVTCERRFDKAGGRCDASQERLFSHSKRRIQVDYNFTVRRTSKAHPAAAVSHG